jgi:outer membrane protein TolC
MRPRWAARVVGGLLAAIALSGCKQQLFIEPADYQEALKAGIPARLETHPHDPIAPSVLATGPGPATVLDPNRPPRYVTLKECIAIAVEQGNLGSLGGPQNAGFVNEQIGQFSGRVVGGTDTIRALVLDPAIIGADIERALSKFDARWINSMTWAKQDQATLSLQQSFSNGDNAQLSTTLAKPLPTGGVAGITFSTNYQNLSDPPANRQFVALNTAYTPRLQFVFEQPLLQAFGVEINQLLPQHPGSALIPGLRPSGGTTTEGILITRIRFDQQKAEFDRQVNNMLLNVEYAYWNLYAAYYNLFGQEAVLRESYYLLDVLQKRFAAGTARQQDVTQTAAQYYRFRRQVIQARQQVLNSERQLRGLLGQRSDNVTDRLVPVDEPNLAPFHPDYYEVANEALAARPELILARHDLKFRQLDLILQKNLRRPDLRFFASYDINGLGARLDGPLTETVESTDPITGLPTTATNPVNALGSLMQNNFNSWQLGLRMDIPLGFRDANAAVRQAQLNLYRSYYQLHDAERKTLEVCTQQYREVLERYEEIKYSRGERIELAETLRLYRVLIEGGQWDVNSLFNVLQVQQQVAAAIAAEFQAIAFYNQALSGLEFAKGTIQRYNNVSVGEGPLPAFVAKKAADHFSAREAALKLRERPASDLPLPPLHQKWEPALENLPPVPAAPPAAVPAPPGGQPLPVPKPLPNLPGGPVTIRPDTPAPSAIAPWTGPGSATTTPITIDPAAPPTFIPIDTVKLPQRRSNGTAGQSDPAPVSGTPVALPEVK